MPEIFINPNYYALLSLVLLASIHVFFRQINGFLSRYWPNWIHVSSGFAVGYVFMYLLPKLALYANQVGINQRDYPLLSITIIFFFMMLGFVTYWLVDLHASTYSSKKGTRLHGLGFIFYNILIGQLLSSGATGGAETHLLITFAMALHLAGMNHLIKHWAPVLFSVTLRWLFVLGLVFGTSLGYFSLVPKLLLIILTAFVGGAILMNVIYYEIPRSNYAHVKPFLLGIVLFTCMCVLIRFLHTGALEANVTDINYTVQLFSVVL